MNISKRDALQWFEFFAQLDEEDLLLPHQQELALAVLCQIETAVTYDLHLRMAGVGSTVKIYQNGGHGYGLPGP